MKLYQYRAKVERIVDGDTCYVLLDMGCHCFHTESLRVAGVNTPELFSGDQREAGGAAREFVVDWVIDAENNAANQDWPFEVETFKDRMTFSRYIGHIVRKDTGESLAAALVAAGHGVAS